MHLGNTITSVWCPATFSAEIVLAIAAQACPHLPVAGDPAAAALAINDATADLMLRAQISTRPKQAAEWANHLAATAEAFRHAFDAPIHRTALRLGIDPTRLRAALAVAAEVQANAARIRDRSRPLMARGRPRDDAEALWLRSLAATFAALFGRPAGISSNRVGQRGGPAAKFIANVAGVAMTDPALDVRQINALQVLKDLRTESAVAGRLQRALATAQSATQLAAPPPSEVLRAAFPGRSEV